ncbi:MAG: DUF2191 domain-containing protein [Nitrospirae bacterium]|nr:MAG: DUF2191 domain-containing protein [Nitrospirota bacterium]
MKTTVDIADGLFEEAKKIIKREKTTMKALIEEGLRRVINEKKRQRRFRLKKVTFKGRGLQADLKGGSWEQIRNRIYEGRGG